MKNLFFALSLILFIAGCDLIESQEDTATVVRKEDKIFIEDRTGKSWDVTHAVNEYGFRPEDFQFGLGPFAITPINDPKMLSPGDAGYPDDNASFLVIGTTINGDTRAYPLEVLSRHEIANERFGNIHVSVAY